MAVTECKLLDDGSISYERNWEFARVFNCTYAITTDTVMGPISAKLAAQSTASGFGNPLPIEGDSLVLLGDADPWSFCEKIVMRRRDPKQWLASVTYKTLPPGKKQEDFNTDPLLRPVKYRKGRLVSTRRVSQDKDGKPIANSAGQEFSETFEEEVSYPLLLATRNVGTLDELFENSTNWEGVVNTDDYRTFSARKWVVLSIEASDLMSEREHEYYQETWTLGLNKNTWDMEALDRGWKVIAGGKLVDATDDNGSPVNEPVNLVDGAKATTLVPPAVPVQGTHFDILTFRWRGEKSFASIPV